MTTRHFRSKSRFAAQDNKKLTWWLCSSVVQQLKYFKRVRVACKVEATKLFELMMLELFELQFTTKEKRFEKL